MKKDHVHAFKISRTGFNPKTKEVGYLDMQCDCGMPLFSRNPTTHDPDGDERPVQVKDMEVNQ